MNKRDSLRHVLGKRALVYIGILAFAIVLLLVLNANSGKASAAGPTYVYQDINTSVQWTEANSPYIVNQSIEITSTGTLTIGPNVTVMVNAGDGITVSGKLVAQGTAVKWIDFTTNDTSPFGYWNGLYFNSTSSGSILSYVIVENASIGVGVQNTSVSMSNIKLVNSDTAGLSWVVDNGNDLTATLTNVEVSNSNDVGILLYSTSGNIVANINNLTVANCYSFGVLVWAPNGNAAVTVDPSKVSDCGDSGLQVEASGTITLMVKDSTFETNYAGITVYGDTGKATITLQNVNLVGNYAGELVTDVSLADVNLMVTNTTINGASADALTNYYPEEIKPTYDIINPGSNYITGGSMQVELPFDFQYGGAVYDYVNVSIDGYIWLGSPFSGNVIQPCSDAFSAYSYYGPYGVPPGVGWKAYSDRIVFQWYVYTGSYSSPSLDVFEAVLYSNGDIQFNYADMTTTYVNSNPYGLEWSYSTLDLRNVMAPNVYDMDYTSVYFRMETFSAGWGIVANAGANITATIKDSSISNEFYGGVSLQSMNGWMNLGVVNSSFEYFLTPPGTTAGLMAMAYNGTITATVDKSKFEYCPFFGVYLASSPMWGGKETTTITNSAFKDVGFMSVVVETLVNDNDGFNPVVNYSSMRMIAGNSFGNASGVLLFTTINSVDSAWNVMMNETVKNNTFSGTSLPTIMGLSIADISGKSLSLPAQRSMEIGLLASYSTISLMKSGSSVTKTDQMTGNIADITGISMIGASAPSSHRAPSNSAPSQPIEAYNGIVVNDWFVSDAGLPWKETVGITDNALNLKGGYLGDAIDVDLYGENHNATMKSTVVTDVLRNKVLAWSNDAWFRNIEVDVEQILQNGKGNGTIAADVTIEKNVVQGASYWAIYVYLDAEMWNQWGNQTATLNAMVTDNQVNNSWNGIFVEVDSYCTFYAYFPPYETKVAASESTTYDVNIVRNTVDAAYEGIYFETDPYVEEFLSVFSHASLTVSGMANISDNKVTMTGSYESYAIDIEYYVGAEAGQAVGIFTDGLVVKDNVINGPGIGYYSEGIYLWPEVDAYAYNLGDTPKATATFTADISGNTISSVEYGIDVEPYADSEYGNASVTSSMSISITGNKITDVITQLPEGSSYGAGIYLYPEVDIYNAESGTNAIANVSWSLVVSNNVVNWTDTNSYATGIYDYYYVSTSDITNGYLTLNLVTEITSNTLTGTGGWGGIDAYSDSTSAGTFDISMNTIATTGEYGIYAEYASVTISKNTISSVSEDGVYLYDCTGSVSNNTVTGASYEGIYVEGCNLLTVRDNTVDMCGDGIGIEYSSDMMVVSNTLTNNGFTSHGYDTYGLWIYECTNISVTGNAITGNYEGLYVEYSSQIIVRNNVVDKNLWNGAEFDYSDQLIIEANSFSANGGDGVYIYYYESGSVVFGNNTVNQNVERGLSYYGYYYYSYASLRLYNGVFADNGWYGVYVESPSAVWIVDAASAVRDNPVYFQGDITVASGGVLTIDTATDFIMAPDNFDGLASIIVKEGGKLVARNSWFWGEGLGGTEVSQGPGSYYEFSVYGTLDMESSTVQYAKELYLGPTSTASIRTSTIMDNYMNGIHVDNCSPTISGTKVLNNWMDGIFIEGSKADPKIRDCLIMENTRGVYAYNSNLGDVTDNLIVMNEVAGIYADHSNGKIHDNVMLFNKREIWIVDSNVSVLNNQIGYSQLVSVMAKYLPFLSTDSGILPISIDGLEISPELVTMMMLDHIGIYAENSTVSASSNVYGLLTYAVYVVDSQLSFNDKVLASELTIPYFDSNGNLLNITVPIHVYDGIYASNSSVTVSGGNIQVLDDAIFLEKSTADLRNVVLNATDMDLYLVDGSTASATNVTFDGGTMAEDTSAVTVNYKLTVIALDQDGKPVGGVWIVVRDAAGNEIAEGATGDDGMFVTYVVGYVQTSAGKSTAMNPYLVNASFDQGSVKKSVTVNGPTVVTVQVPVVKAKPVNLAPLVGIVAVAVVLMAMLLLTVRGRP
ncbi:MAG: right-handed parallel beta-helix repeat-containing protein [Methanomassiliicoccales archaeon]|jgi:parallel beta-helix repeat protein